MDKVFLQPEYHNRMREEGLKEYQQEIQHLADQKAQLVAEIEALKDSVKSLVETKDLTFANVVDAQTKLDNIGEELAKRYQKADSQIEDYTRERAAAIVAQEADIKRRVEGLSAQEALVDETLEKYTKEIEWVNQEKQKIRDINADLIIRMDAVAKAEAEISKHLFDLSGQKEFYEKAQASFVAREKSLEERENVLAQAVSDLDKTKAVFADEVQSFQSERKQVEAEKERIESLNQDTQVLREELQTREADLRNKEEALGAFEYDLKRREEAVQLKETLS